MGQELLVHDIFNNTFQILTIEEKSHPASKVIAFNDFYFAEKFLRWLKVRDNYWRHVPNIDLNIYG